MIEVQIDKALIDLNLVKILSHQIREETNSAQSVDAKNVFLL